MTAITINRHMFDVPDDPELRPGAPLTEGMVSTLAQTRRENVRNSMSKKVEEARGEAESLTNEQYAQLQQQVNQYAQRFQFGVRMRSTRTYDPVEREARHDAAEVIKASYFARHNIRLKTSEVAEAVDEIMHNPQQAERYRSRARERIAEREATIAREDPLAGTSLAA